MSGKVSLSLGTGPVLDGSPCCMKIYSCRVCHDENENHEIQRNKVTQIKCLQCAVVQEVNKNCSSCGIEFGKYFCVKCRLYDDADKGQFHCDGCGLCRVGGQEKFFHCEKCDMCLAITLKGKHKCIEDSSRRNCAVCLEDLHTSRTDAHIPKCGHLIHRLCLESCMKTGNYACPTCGESLVDMKKAWKILDDEVANTKMPDEYKDFNVFILCKDCHKESKVLFHVIGLKCQHCGSYNTCRTDDPDNKGNKTGGAEGSTSDETQSSSTSNDAASEDGSKMT
ncbi:RING finger and CHY zinc finger domain-containing protein 1 [Mactra antiquata]